MIEEFPEHAVLVENEDGTYVMMVDGEEICTLQSRDDEPFASMPVIPFKE